MLEPLPYRSPNDERPGAPAAIAGAAIAWLIVATAAVGLSARDRWLGPAVTILLAPIANGAILFVALARLPRLRVRLSDQQIEWYVAAALTLAIVATMIDWCAGALLGSW